MKNSEVGTRAGGARAPGKTRSERPETASTQVDETPGRGVDSGRDFDGEAIFGQPQERWKVGAVAPQGEGSKGHQSELSTENEQKTMGAVEWEGNFPNDTPVERSSKFPARIQRCRRVG